MKALILLLLSAPAMAQTMIGGCGLPPFPPAGYYYICVCQGPTGDRCGFVLVKKP